MRIIFRPFVSDSVASFMKESFNDLRGGRDFAESNFPRPAILQNWTLCVSAEMKSMDTPLAAGILQFFNDKPGAYISYFSVHMQLRRRGVGRYCVRKIQYTFPVLRLQCFEDNPGGLAFWKSVGFHTVCARGGVAQMIWKAK